MGSVNSKVYIRIDNKNRVINIDGGYTIQNINDIENWILIDEGIGDRYNLCQSNYLEKPIKTIEGIYQYKYNGNEIVERDQGEIAIDQLSLQSSPPSELEQLRADVDYLLMLEENRK